MPKLSGEKSATCKTCGAEIIWATTIHGKAMPLDAKAQRRFVAVPPREAGEGFAVDLRETWASHFATCPQAEQHRKKGEQDAGRQN